MMHYNRKNSTVSKRKTTKCPSHSISAFFATRTLLTLRTVQSLNEKVYSMSNCYIANIHVLILAYNRFKRNGHQFNTQPSASLVQLHSTLDHIITKMFNPKRLHLECTNTLLGTTAITKIRLVLSYSSQ